MKPFALAVTASFLSLFSGITQGLIFTEEPDLVTPGFLERYDKAFYSGAVLDFSKTCPIVNYRDKVIGFAINDRHVDISRYSENQNFASIAVWPEENGLYRVKKFFYENLHSSSTKQKDLGRMNIEELNKLLNKECFSTPLIGNADRRKMLAAIAEKVNP